MKPNATTLKCDLLGCTRARSEGCIAFLWFEDLLLHPGDCNVFFRVWLSQILTWLQLLQFLNVSQHFGENIITLHISLAHEYWVPQMNFDKVFGTFFWKEGHGFRASLLTCNEQLQILYINRECWAEAHQVWALKLSLSQVPHLLICHVNITVTQPIGYTSNLWSYTVIFNTFLVRSSEKQREILLLVCKLMASSQLQLLAWQ